MYILKPIYFYLIIAIMWISFLLGLYVGAEIKHVVIVAGSFVVAAIVAFKIDRKWGNYLLWMTSLLPIYALPKAILDKGYSFTYLWALIICLIFCVIGFRSVMEMNKE